MINLSKGQKINLTKDNGQKLTQACVGLNWGAIEKKGFFGGVKKATVDLDASCAVFDADNNVIDVIYYGNLKSNDLAIQHSGDDLTGDMDGDDGLDNEIITVNLNKLSPKADKIVFILNSFNGDDFATIPYAHLRIYEGTPSRVDSVLAKFNVAAESAYKGYISMVMGRFYRRNGEWKFATTGEPTQDTSLENTIATIQEDFV
jgi:tellurium resistance protein TerZ